MKGDIKPYGEFLVLLIVLCLGLLYIIRLSKVIKEGFYYASPEQDSYESLRSNLQQVIMPYCKISNFIQGQMMKIYQSEKVTVPIPAPPPNKIEPPKFTPGEPSNAPKGWWGDSKPAAPLELDPKVPPSTPSLSSSTSVPKTPGESQNDAWNHLQETYTRVYNCTDELAGSRAQCGGGSIFLLPEKHPDWHYVPCSAYDLPAYNKDNTPHMLTALINIPNNTPKKLQMEIAWFLAVINKLQSGIDAGKNLPTDASGKTGIPANPEMPHEDNKDPPAPPQPNPPNPASPPGATAAQNSLLAAHGYKTIGSKKEGFFDAGECPFSAICYSDRYDDLSAAFGPGTSVESASKLLNHWNTFGKGEGRNPCCDKCSPNAMAIRNQRAQQAKQVQPRPENIDACIMPELPTEIARVNAILNNADFLTAMRQCDAIYAAAMKLQSDIEKLKAGNLYEWQQSGPTKTYSKFKGGDRQAGFLASLSQNKDFTGN